MIDEAAEAGADIAKFQSYRGIDVSVDDPEREWFTKVELTCEMHHKLNDHAKNRGIEFLSSPFTIERAKLLCEDLGLSKIKIASSEMLNFTLLDYVNDNADTVFLSTGLANLDEIGEAISHLDQVRNKYILHCCTQYPTLDYRVNLRAISQMQIAFPGNSIGFSDHTLGIDASVAAVALGARVIEKHFTLDKTLPGTDHILSATPEELRELVTRIRRTEILLGDPIKQPQPEELEILEFVRSRFPKN